MKKNAHKRCPSGTKRRAIKPTLCVTIDAEVLAKLHDCRPAGMSMSCTVGLLLRRGLKSRAALVRA